VKLLVTFVALLLVMVVLVAVGADAAVVGEAERRIEERVAEQVPEAELVTADIQGFPVAARLLATGKINEVEVMLENVALAELSLERVVVLAEGVKLSRADLLDGRIDIEEVSRATLTARITETALSRTLPAGVTLALTPGQAEATVAGVTTAAEVTAVEGVLQLRGGGLVLDVLLPTDFLLPCPLDGAVVADAVELSCVIDRVPDWVLTRAVARSSE
jgi:hypothetical protein